MKLLKEWNIDAPWGKIALISWGNPKGYPVLLVHGREDSAATFVPLLKLLPNNYHYVAIDLPGHGKSEPFPPGVMIARFHFNLGVEYAVAHLKWKKFIYIAHSMGTEAGLFYNAIYPGRVTKFIHLDPTPAILRMFQKKFPILYQGYYETYYENYERYNNEPRVYTKEQAMRAVMNARGLNEEQAELILSRNLIPVGDGMYKMSWSRILKITAPWNFTDDFYYTLFTENAPPTLVLSATVTNINPNSTIRVHNFITRLKDRVPNFYHFVVEGGHDLHFLKPESIADKVKMFLKSDYDKLEAKSNKAKL